MKIFRSEAALMDDSMRRQLLDLFIVRMLERRELTDPMSFEILCNMCPDEPSEQAMLAALMDLLDSRILIEAENGLLTLVRPCEAQVQAGLFTEDTLDLVPPGTQVFSLTDDVRRMVEEKGVDEACKEIFKGIAAVQESKLN